MTWARDLLARTRRGCGSGVDFDTREGHRFVRFSFAGPRADVTEGLAASGSHLA